MKRQSTALVLCALLLSTFGHDILNAHQLNRHRLGEHHEARKEHHGEDRSQSLRPIIEPLPPIRWPIPSQCHIECPGGTPLPHVSSPPCGSSPIPKSSEGPSPTTPSPAVTTRPPIISTPPVTKPPVTKQPSTKPPVTKQPPTKPPVTKQPPTKPPVTKQPPTKPPVTKQPPTKPPVTKQPPTKPAVTKQPPTKPPVTKQPPTKPSVTKQPPTKPPVTRPPPVTPLPPTGGLNGTLTVIINATSSLIGVWNRTAQVSIIFDLSASLVAVFNGSSGAAVIINIKSQQGIYIAGGASAQLWISSKISFEVFISGLSSLQVVWNIGLRVGKSFSVSSASQVVLVEVSSILIQISAEFSIQLSGSASASLSLLINLSGQVVGLFGAQFSLFLTLLTSRAVVFKGDIQSFIGKLGGIVRIVGLIKGGVSALISAKISFDLSILLSFVSAGEVLAQVVKIVSVKLGVSVFGSLFVSASSFLSVVVQLNGDVVVGVGGVFNVLNQVLAVLQNGASAEVLIQVLIRFAVSVRGQGSLSAQFSAAIQALLSQVQGLNAGASSSAVILFLQNIRDNKLEVSGVNVSGIIQILVEAGAPGAVPLNVVVQVLLKLSGRLEAALLLPLLLLVILSELTSQSGLVIIVGLIPGLGIDANSVASGNFNVFTYILARINVVSLLFSGFDIVRFIRGLPIIGAIFNAISAALHAASNGSLQFEVIIKSRGGSSVVTKIWSFFSASLHINVSGHIGTKHLNHEHEAGKHHHLGEKEHHSEHHEHLGEKNYLEHQHLKEHHNVHEHEKVHNARD